MKGIHTQKDLELVQALAQDAPGAPQAFENAYYELWLERAAAELPDLPPSKRQPSFRAAVDTLRQAYLAPGGIRREGDALFGITVDLPTFLVNLVKRRSKVQQQEARDCRIIRRLQENRQDALQEVYEAYWAYYLRYADKAFPALSREVKEDIFQDAWIVIIEKYIRAGRIGVVDGKAVEGLTVKFSSFHYSICWNMMAKYGRPELPPAPEMEEAQPPATSRLPELLQPLRLHDKRLIFYRFYLKLSYEQIKEITDATSVGVLRTQLYRCLRKLRAGLVDSAKPSASGDPATGR